MQVGDLIYAKPRTHNPDNLDFIGLLVSMAKLGTGTRGSTILYDVLFPETNEVHTLSDIYFEVWRVE